MLENHPENQGTPAEEQMGDFGDKESQAREDRMMLTPISRTASPSSSLTVLGPCDQKNLLKVTRWLTNIKSNLNCGRRPKGGWDVVS